MRMPKPKPCRKCKSTDLNVWDRGYSSFNVGGVKCNACGHEVKVSPCGLDPNKELIQAWNNDKPSKAEVIETARLRCNYIIGTCQDLREAQVEAEAILKAIGESDGRQAEGDGRRRAGAARPS